MAKTESFGQFVGESWSVVDLAEGFEDSLGAHGNGAGLGVGIRKLVSQAFDIRVEDDADDFAVTVNDGTSRVAAGDALDWVI